MPGKEAPELPYDLETLSLISGINLSHLQSMYDGEMSPNEFHMARLSRLLDSESMEWMGRHDQLEPDYIKSRYGSVPEGYHLLHYIPAAEIQPGDLIAYKPPYRDSGNKWGEVLHVEQGDTLVIVDVHESIKIELPSAHPARVARLEEKNQNDSRSGVAGGDGAS